VWEVSAEKKIDHCAHEGGQAQRQQFIEASQRSTPLTCAAGLHRQDQNWQTGRGIYGKQSGNEVQAVAVAEPGEWLGPHQKEGEGVPIG
jgi:hypothetical protein